MRVYRCNMHKKGGKMKGILLDEFVVVDKKNDLINKGYGEVHGNKIKLNLIEALFLTEKGDLDVFFKEKKMSFEKFLNYVKKFEEKVYERFLVYRDIRMRGYVIKTGFKFGVHFRVYDRGKFMKEHSKFLVHVFTENEKITMFDIARFTRIATSVKKEMIIAVVDGEGDISYYKLSRVTP